MVRGDFNAWLGVALAAALTGGCATMEPDVLDFGVAVAGVAPHLPREITSVTWPPVQDGDPARYAYAGQLIGEANFRRARPLGAGETLGENIISVLSWIVGLAFGERVPAALQRPQAGVVDEAGQRILVTDASHQAVYVFDQQAGQLDIWEYADGFNKFITPVGIALGEAGDIYVADAERGYVARLDSKGNSLGPIGKGKLRRPVGVAFDTATRQLFVSDIHAHDIKVFGADGSLLRTLGQRGEELGEFNFPAHLALAQGELYVTDTLNWRVQVLDTQTGAVLRSIGARGTRIGNLAHPKGVTVDNEGNVYIIESYNDHLLVFNRAGEFLLPIGGTGDGIGQFFMPAGVWRDAQNRIFVADMFNARVVLFKFLGGEPETVLGGEKE